jgi:hypothetical protein
MSGIFAADDMQPTAGRADEPEAKFGQGDILAEGCLSDEAAALLSRLLVKFPRSAL